MGDKQHWEWHFRNTTEVPPLKGSPLQDPEFITATSDAQIGFYPLTKAGSGLAKPMAFYRWTTTSKTTNFGTFHHTVEEHYGPVWKRSGGQMIPPNPTGGHDSVYVPSSFVVHYNEWAPVLEDAAAVLNDIGLSIQGAISGDPHATATAAANGINKIMGAEGDIEHLVDALKNNTGINLDKLQEQLQESMQKACDTIGADPAAIKALAEKMGLGDDWAFLAGPEYWKTIKDDSNYNDKNGWVVLAKDAAGIQYVANHAFISNGHLYQAHPGSQAMLSTFCKYGRQIRDAGETINTVLDSASTSPDSTNNSMPYLPLPDFGFQLKPRSPSGLGLLWLPYGGSFHQVTFARYIVSIDTAKETGSGTNASIHLKITGESGETAIEVNTNTGQVGEGGLDHFFFLKDDVGIPTQIEVDNDGGHLFPNWHISSIKVRYCGKDAKDAKDVFQISTDLKGSCNELEEVLPCKTYSATLGETPLQIKSGASCLFSLVPDTPSS